MKKNETTETPEKPERKPRSEPKFTRPVHPIVAKKRELDEAQKRATRLERYFDELKEAAATVARLRTEYLDLLKAEAELHSSNGMAPE